MKIVIKKEDERKISGISDKLNTIATVKTVEDEPKKPRPKDIQLVHPGESGGNLLKKNVNTFILILIIILICGGVGVSVLYMNIIKNVSGEKDTLTENYSSCRASLENYMGVLSMTEQELNSTSADIKKYDALYEEKASLLETTQNELQSTKTELTSTKTLFERATENLKKATQDVTTLTTERDSLRLQLNASRTEVARLNILVNNLKDDLEACN